MQASPASAEDPSPRATTGASEDAALLELPAPVVGSFAALLGLLALAALVRSLRRAWRRQRRRPRA